MVFKGTQNRTARQIAEQMDAVGGQLNAFTGKDCTCYYAKVIDEDLPLAVDIVSDLVLRPLLCRRRSAQGTQRDSGRDRHGGGYARRT